MSLRNLEETWDLPVSQPWDRLASLCKTGRGSLPGAGSAGTLILNFLSFRSMRNEPLFLKAPGLCPLL